MADRIAHEPVERPLPVIAAEFGLTAAQAYLVGLCLAIAAQQDEAPFVQFGLAAIAVGLVFSYGLWLLGGSGLPMALLNLPLLVLAADATLVASGFVDLGVGDFGLLGPDLGGPGPPLLAVLSAGAGVICGLVLPGPRRLRLTGPGRRARAVTASGEISHGAVMERLRTAAHVPISAVSPRDTVWFDEMGEDHPSELEPEDEMDPKDEYEADEELEAQEHPWPARSTASSGAVDYLEPEQVASELPSDDDDDPSAYPRGPADLDRPLEPDEPSERDDRRGDQEAR